MQSNSQPSKAQRPAARPQQGYTLNAQRPAARPQPTGARPAVRPGQGVQQGARPATRPQQTAYGARPTAQRSAGQQVPRPAARPAAGQPQSRPVQSQQRRPAPSSGTTAFRGSRDSKSVIITAIAAAVILIVGCLMQFVIYPAGYFPADTAKAVTAVAEIASSRGVRINEVMTSNKTALSDSEGSYPDWIELANTSNETVDISGWALLDKASRSTYFTFPEYQLDPGEMVIVFASGHIASESGADFHAPFRLSSMGDTLMLSDSHSTVVESINIPALGANQSYAQTNSGWTVTSEYTPGLENTSLNYAALTSTQPVSDAALLITEVMADNASYKAPDGVLYDWIEIQNVGSSAIDLRGYGLSDDAGKPSQWKFPSVTIQPGQCLLVYASGLDWQDEDGTLHANFGLRAEGESILLYNASAQVLDHVEFDNLKADQSLRRQSDGSYTTSGTATPGQAN